MNRTVASVLLLILVATVSFEPQIACARARPRLSYVNGRHSVELSPQMNLAIRRYDSTFEPWDDEDYLPSVRKYYRYTEHQSPFAVLGYMNGDGRIDAILDGQTRAGSARIAVLSRGRGYRVHVLSLGGPIDPKTTWYGSDTDREYGLSGFLAHRAPGRIKSPYEKLPLYLRTDAFETVAFERASTLYYFRGGRFHWYTTSD